MNHPTQAANYIHALDAYMLNNAYKCIQQEMPYSQYNAWLDSFVCEDDQELKIDRLDEVTYNKLAALNQQEQ